MMPSKIIFTIILAFITVTFFAVLLTLHNAGPPANPPSNTQETKGEQVDTLLDDRSSVDPPAQQDGSTLIEEHCVECHASQWLEKIQKTRSDWERTLIEMETMGVRLSDAEKKALLDFLAGGNQP